MPQSQLISDVTIECREPGRFTRLNPFSLNPFSLVLNRSPIHVTRSFPILAPRFALPAPFFFAASGCRFSLPFLLPLLVAVLQSKITVQYNGEW